MESRTQGSRPRTQKNFEAKTRLFRGQGPRTQMQVFSKKKGSQNFFSCDFKNKVFKNFFQALKVFKQIFFRRFLLEETKINVLQIFRKVSGVFQRNFNDSKIVQCCPRAEDRAIFEDLRLPGLGQGLQNVSSRPRTSSRTPPLMSTSIIFLCMMSVFH